MSSKKPNGDRPAFPSAKAAEAVTEATSDSTTETHAHTTARHDGLTIHQLYMVVIAAGHRAGGLAANADTLAELAERDADALCARMDAGGAE